MKIKILFLLSFLSVVVLFWLYYQIYFPQGSFCEGEIIFLISKGDGFLKIGNNLKKENIIKNSFYFKTYALLSGKFNKFQAGNYFFCDNQSIKDVIEKISRGEVAQKKITIVEGWNIGDVAESLEELKIVKKDIFLNNANNFEFNYLYNFLEEKPEGLGLEGYLFPDTYFIPYNTDAELIIKIMLANFDNKLTEDLRNEIRNQGKSIFEVITVASLIEKEVKNDEDKKLVSGVIWKRLKINMPLQIDATISYITGKRTTKISTQETQIDSPYNTYKYRGLPIGPICNPGIKSIKAAIFPKESDYLFYLSKSDGETIFSENLEKHNIAKNEYLK